MIRETGGVVTKFSPLIFNGLRCDVCGEVNGKKCLGCQTACYCCPNCEKSDLPHHGLVCSDVKKDSELKIIKARRKYDPVTACQICNNIWIFPSNLVTQGHIISSISAHFRLYPVAHTDEEDPAEKIETTPTDDKGKEVHEVDNEVRAVIVLMEWLTHHFSPCTFIIQTRDNPNGLTYWLLPPSMTCMNCKSRASVFCRKCTFFNFCKSCATYDNHNKTKLCCDKLNTLNIFVKRLIFKRNKFAT